MTWDKYKVQRWLLRVGMNHLQSDLFAEGGELIYESKFGEAAESKDKFIAAIKRICCWDDEMIEESLEEISNDTRKIDLRD
jgi:hypothetical protein